MPKRLSVDEFCQRVDKAYDGRISVVRETYIDTHHKVTAYCNVHKIYFECESNTLRRRKCDCPECVKETRKNAGIKNAKPWNEVHKSFIDKYGNKFSYDESSYKGTKQLMKVRCNDCGEEFEITPVHHLKYNNGGCPNCSKKRIVKCSKCGKEIEVDRHVGPNFVVYCDECKKENDAKYCKICGKKLNDDLKCENQFCNEHHIQTFETLIKYFTFDKNKLGTEEAEQEFYRIKDMLYDMYWKQQMSSSQICKVFNYPSGSRLINNVFFRLNIPAKKIKDAVKEAIKNGVVTYNNVSNNQYKSSHHTTWDNKTVYLRSSYEEDYAQLLDASKIKYEVEKLRIEYYDSQEQEKRTAIPDFYLVDTNTIVEIKSSWTLDVINMLDKLKAYKELGYNFKLILEHKEVDIYSLLDKPIYKYKGRKHNSLKCERRTNIFNNKWRWMNDGKQNYKVIEKEIDDYLNKGFVFGCLIKKSIK